MGRQGFDDLGFRNADSRVPGFGALVEAACRSMLQGLGSQALGHYLLLIAICDCYVQCRARSAGLLHSGLGGCLSQATLKYKLRKRQVAVDGG